MSGRGAHQPTELAELPRKYEKYFDENRPTVLVESVPRKTWTVGKINDLHHEIKRRLLLGQSNKYIASQLGCTPQTVSNVRNSPIIQEQLTLMRSARDAEVINVAAHIQRIAPKSIKLLEEVIGGTGAGADAPLSLRVRAAESNLDRAGFGAVKKFQGAVGHFTSDDIAKLKEEALGRVSPVVQE